MLRPLGSTLPLNCSEVTVQKSSWSLLNTTRLYSLPVVMNSESVNVLTCSTSRSYTGWGTTQWSCITLYSRVHNHKKSWKITCVRTNSFGSEMYCLLVIVVCAVEVSHIAHLSYMYQLSMHWKHCIGADALKTLHRRLMHCFSSDALKTLHLERYVLTQILWANNCCSDNRRLFHYM